MSFVDEAGKTLAQDARSFLGLKELNTVVVQGQMRRDGERLFVVARGVFVKKK